jgi:hypothetical protein
MGHQDKGHFAAKHPAGTQINPEIGAAIDQVAQDGAVTCAAAHKIAQKFAVAPAEVGMTIDLMEYRLTRCQLGLFGYARPSSKVAPAATIAPQLATAIQNGIENQRIACLACWKIAARLDISRIEAAQTCEALKIKIGPCQLGAF